MADSQFTYSPIDLSTNAIRVLRLCHGYGTDPIVCELVQILLEDDGVPYEALSYAWGTAPEDVQITLDGQVKMIKDNLFTALSCLRRATEDRWLWVDALCIDQADHREKTHQVGRMRQIYEKADWVLIWLGQSTEEVDLLMEMANTFGKRARRRSTYRKNTLDAWLEEWPMYIAELGGIQTEFNTRRRNGLLHLLDRPWFRRVWVVQEAFMARRATVLCGWNELPSEVFVLLPMMMQIEADEDVQSVLDVMPGYFRQSSWRGYETSLQTLLAKFKNSGATDPRDNIYALLGIASDVRSNGKLQPDYSVSTQSTFHAAISYLVFGENPASPICALPPWNFYLLTNYLTELPERVLEWAIKDAEQDTVRELLARTRVNVNSSSTGEPFLIYAVSKKHVLNLSIPVLQLLLEHRDIDVNITDSRGNTALHIAVASGRQDIVSILLATKDVKLNLYNLDGFTPLGIAIEKDNTDMARRLIQHDGVNLDCLMGRKKTLLLFVVIKKRRHLLELLLQRGASVNLRDLSKRNYTALITAAKKGDLELVELLLKHGADPNIECSIGVGENETPAGIAKQNGHNEIVQLLIDHGATPPPISPLAPSLALWPANKSTSQQQH